MYAKRVFWNHIYLLLIRLLYLSISLGIILFFCLMASHLGPFGPIAWLIWPILFGFIWYKFRRQIPKYRDSVLIDVDKVNYYPIDYIDLSETSSELALVVKRLKKVYSSTSRLAGFGSDLDLYVCIESIINGRSISTGIGISNYAVDHCSDREIQAIYLHELKHVKNRDALFHIICSNIMPFLVPITSALIILIIIFGNPALIPFIVITLLSLPAVELANDIFAEADADLLPTSLGFGRELIATIGTYPSGKYTLRQKRILKLLNND